MKERLRIRPTETMVSKSHSRVVIDCEDSESADNMFEWLLELLDDWYDCETCGKKIEAHGDYLEHRSKCKRR